MLKKILLFVLLVSSSFVQARFHAETFYDLHYGPHERQIFDIWLPKSLKKTPLVIYIHGGGFVMGSKDEVRKNRIIKKYNEAGIAFAAINYRYLKHTALQNIMREDIAGFVQYIRANHREFNINKKLIMSHGFSAGGSSSLWLATHDDIADPDHADPMKQESSRILAAGHLSAQVSYDFIDWFKYFGRENVERYVGEQIWSRYHLAKIEDLFTPIGEAIRKDLDMYENMSADDAPVLFWNGLPDIESQDGSHFMHSPRHAKLLHARAGEVGLETKLLLDGDRIIKYDVLNESFKFFIEKIEVAKKNQRRLFF
jgi:hypothetical protein